MASGTVSLVAVHRDARKSALLRMRLKDDIDVIGFTESLSSHPVSLSPSSNAQ
jgi:hypothetical protein